VPGAQLDIARQGIEAYNRGDIDALLRSPPTTSSS
jgi:hypothetical protein